MNYLFNIFIITKNDDFGSIYNKLEDFINHLHKDYTSIDVIEFSNCISLFARSNEDTLCFIIDSHPSFKDNLDNATSFVFNYLNYKLQFKWNYVDKKDLICDYQNEITNDNINFVINLRKELVSSILNNEGKFTNISKTTKQSILDGTYKIQNEFSTKCIFLNALKLTLKNKNLNKNETSNILTNEDINLINKSILKIFEEYKQTRICEPNLENQYNNKETIGENNESTNNKTLQKKLDDFSI